MSGLARITQYRDHLTVLDRAGGPTELPLASHRVLAHFEKARFISHPNRFVPAKRFEDELA
jgi:hypothetical protein